MGKNKRKQFDISHLELDERLQGVKLASFSQRVTAFVLDWAILALSVRYFAVGFTLLVAYLLVKKRALRTARQGSQAINAGVDQLEERLRALRVSRKLRVSFSRYTRWYIHIMLILFLGASLVVGGVAIAGVFFPEQLNLAARESEVNIFMQPFDGFYNELRIVVGAFGGIVYFALFSWKWAGQTPGKRIMGIRVVKLSNTPLTLWNSFERVSGYASSASLLLLGFFQYFWDRNHQTTHDKISETIVIEADSLLEEAPTNESEVVDSSEIP